MVGIDNDDEFGPDEDGVPQEAYENDGVVNPVDVLAADIRAVDGNHDLGAGELAQKLADLGWTKGKVVAYPFKSGDTLVLGPELIATPDGKVLNWKGQNYVPQVAAEVDPHPPLKSYKDGEQVEAVKDGDWLVGFIQDRDRVSGYLHVHTRRGPVTIASRTSIRKLTK